MGYAVPLVFRQPSTAGKRFYDRLILGGFSGPASCGWVRENSGVIKKRIIINTKPLPKMAFLYGIALLVHLPQTKN
jgi:hypothetical protein